MKIVGILALVAIGWLAIMVLLGHLPKILAAIYDPPRIKRIAQFFEASGCTVTEIKPWPSHFGAHYVRDGVKGYAKCRINIKSGIIGWVGGAPDWATA